MLSQPYSAKPDKLIRIVVVPENTCNYNCIFCCLTRNKSNFSTNEPDSVEYYNNIIEASIKSGCKRVMLTGGEPFLCNKERLVNIIKIISIFSKDLSDFWICTNGSLISKEMCEEIKSAGLNKIVVTIAAESNEKYKNYTNQNNYTLEKIFGNLEILINLGFQVKVDIPLNRAGIKNINEFLLLIRRLEVIGVKEVAYFQLHKTDMNIDVFDELFVNHELITLELANINSIKILDRENGQKIFSYGNINIIIPTNIQHETDNCFKNGCGLYCQGIYAAYLKSNGDEFVLQACHRKLDGNIFHIPKTIIKEEHNKILDTFNEIWSWAYQVTPLLKK